MSPEHWAYKAESELLHAVVCAAAPVPAKVVAEHPPEQPGPVLQMRPLGSLVPDHPEQA